MTSSNITIVTSLSHFNSLTTNNSRSSIIDFHATWCGPCKVIAPKFATLSTQFPSMQFLKVDVDAVPEVAQLFRVSAMPTFVILQGSNKVEEMKGADPARLEAMVRKHATVGSSVSSSGGSSSTTVVEKGLEGFGPLNEFIDAQQSSCLNESISHTSKDLLKGGGDKWLESDSDEQLLLTIPMHQAIRLRAIRFTTVPSALAQAPKKIRLFVNNRSIGFDDAESLEPAQELELTSAQSSGTEAVHLRFVRFQKVNVLSIFVVDNQEGGEVTRVDKIELIGSTAENMDMAKWSKGEPEQ